MPSGEKEKQGFQRERGGRRLAGELRRMSLRRTRPKDERMDYDRVDWGQQVGSLAGSRSDEAAF